MHTAFSVVLIAALSQGQTQSTLETVRDLYASAAFEEALTALAKLADDSAPKDERLADEYRMFTLIALGRTAAAEAAAEMLIRRDPLGRLQSPDASPRLHSMFDAVRGRVLPQVVRDKYRSGRAAIENKDFASAARDLGETQRLISEMRSAGIDDAGLADLRDLVDGFLVLAKSQPGAPSNTAGPSTAARAPSASGGAAAPARAAGTTRIYDNKDADVTPPTTISQDMPDLPPSLRALVSGAGRQMIVSVTIDERGRVRHSELVTPINPVYDRLVMAASKHWRYRPATKGGAPVGYQKVISITVKQTDGQ